MPAQALIRKLTKDQVAQKITANKAGDLLEVLPRVDGVLVVCKMNGGAQLPGAVEALQIICDEDSKIVRTEAKAAADEAARVKMEAVTAAAAAAAAAAGRP